MEPMKSSIGMALSVSYFPVPRPELQGYAGDDLLIGRLHDVDEVELTEGRPLRFDRRAELLDLPVHLSDP